MRRFMLKASEKGYTKGDHVFIDVELFESYAFGNKSWQRGKDDDDKAKEAYRSLIRISLPPMHTEKFRQFDQEVRRRVSIEYGDGVFMANETVCAKLIFNRLICLFLRQNVFRSVLSSQPFMTLCWYWRKF